MVMRSIRTSRPALFCRRFPLRNRLAQSFALSNMSPTFRPAAVAKMGGLDQSSTTVGLRIVWRLKTVNLSQKGRPISTGECSRRRENNEAGMSGKFRKALNLLLLPTSSRKFSMRIRRASATKTVPTLALTTRLLIAGAFVLGQPVFAEPTQIFPFAPVPTFSAHCRPSSRRSRSCPSISRPPQAG